MVGTGVLLSGSAYAAAPHSRAGRTPSVPLPPVGTNILCTMYAANVPLKLKPLGVLTLDFKGGITFMVQSSNANGCVLEVQGFRMEADMSPSTPDSGTLLALTMSNSKWTPLSTLTSAGLLLVHMALTVSHHDKAAKEEIDLGATYPTRYVTLRSENIKAFPPVNQPWTLQKPVTMYTPGGSATADVAGTLGRFDALVDHAA